MKKFSKSTLSLLAILTVTACGSGSNGSGGVGESSPSTITDSKLPPDPGSKGKETIEGVDSNSNGVRDDVEIAIVEKYGDKPLLVKALMQYSEIYEKTLLAKNKQERLELQLERMLASNCLGHSSRENNISSQDTLSFLLSKVVNTRERAEAADRSNSYMAYQVYKTPEEIGCKF